MIKIVSYLSQVYFSVTSRRLGRRHFVFDERVNSEEAKRLSDGHMAVAKKNPIPAILGLSLDFFCPEAAKGKRNPYASLLCKGGEKTRRDQARPGNARDRACLSGH